jgi:glutamate synthase domain-containing protein 3
MKKMEIDTTGLHFKELNQNIRDLIAKGYTYFILKNVLGQRYIGCGINKKIKFDIYGTPGNDLGAFMNGPEINVFGNAQDCVANTMNSGEIVIHGDVSDILGYGMRGGSVYVKGSVGYRIGIHTKEYEDQIPFIVIGETAGKFLGEYMGGGTILLLNIKNEKYVSGNFTGTGMHGGKIYVNGKIDNDSLGKEVKSFDLTKEDRAIITPYIKKYCKIFKNDFAIFDFKKFQKILPVSKRPYGRLYV